MRVFGYGSLMWNSWCDDLPCVSRKVGVLRGYRRVFNKASTRNWGTKDMPGPTLNLVLDPQSSCKGVVFEFPDANRDDVMARLKDREGKGFNFPELPIRMCLSTTVPASVPIYAGKNTIEDRTTDEIIAMMLVAKGENGLCRDYVTNLSQHMKVVGITDPMVEIMAAKIKEKDAQRAPPNREQARGRQTDV